MEIVFVLWDRKNETMTEILKDLMVTMGIALVLMETNGLWQISNTNL